MTGPAGGFQVKAVLDEILEKIPETFNMAEIMGKAAEKTPYVVVAFQECERMNILTNEMRRSLKELSLGLKVRCGAAGARGRDSGSRPASTGGLTTSGAQQPLHARPPGASAPQARQAAAPPPLPGLELAAIPGQDMGGHLAVPPQEAQVWPPPGQTASCRHLSAHVGGWSPAWPSAGARPRTGQV